MRKRSFAALVFGVLTVTGVLAPAAPASNLSYPATYTGTVSGGGTVEFDVSGDGSAVTRFAVKGVNTSCASFDSTTTGSTPIVNDAFEYMPSSGVRFKGSFPAVQQAQGTVSIKLSFPYSCTSEEVPWTASTPTPPPDTTPPNTKIKSGPKGTVHSKKATFRFAATEPGSTFQCKLDKKKWSPCKSSKTYKGLKDGKHVFKVKATDAAGNTDPTPAKRSWRVD